MNDLEWRPYSEFNNVWVRTDGKVRRLIYEGTKREKIVEDYGTPSDGYRVIGIPGTNKQELVHRLVADVFITKTQEDVELGREFINHIDECKSNNSVNNLEWVTKKENSNHGTAIIRRLNKVRGVQRPNVQGSKNYNSRIIERFDLQTLETIQVYHGGQREMIAQGFNPGNVYQCCKGKLKFYKGFGWRYAS